MTILDRDNDRTSRLHLLPHPCRLTTLGTSHLNLLPHPWRMTTLGRIQGHPIASTAAPSVFSMLSLYLPMLTTSAGSTRRRKALSHRPSPTTSRRWDRSSSTLWRRKSNPKKRIWSTSERVRQTLKHRHQRPRGRVAWKQSGSRGWRRYVCDCSKSFWGALFVHQAGFSCSW